MNNDQKYSSWRGERPLPLNIPPDFAGDVMRRVYRVAEQQQKTNQKWPGLINFLQQNRSLQFAVLAVAAIVGLIRFWLMLSIILEP
jgi:hypothetical protein